MTFDKKWDLDIYKKKKQINKYPHDKIVTFINKYFSKKKNILKKLVALDLGCGTGNNTKFLSEYGFGKVIGIDGSISAVKEAKNFCASNKRFSSKSLLMLPNISLNKLIAKSLM